MLILFSYILSVFLVGGTFFLLNLRHKWVTKEKCRDDIDGDMVVADTVFGILFWPIALIVLAFVFGWKFIVEHLIP